MVKCDSGSTLSSVKVTSGSYAGPFLGILLNYIMVSVLLLYVN